MAFTKNINGERITGSISGTSISATTFYSGSTNLSSLIGGGGGASTFVQPGSNISTGGTASSPTISLASTIAVNTISVSGNNYNTGQYWSGVTSFDTILGRLTKNASSSGNSVSVLDSRSVNETPTGRSVGVYFDFKQNSTDGLSDGSTYHSILHYRGYGAGADLSGGNPHQLGLTQNNNMYIRTGTGATGWTVWKKFLLSGETNILPTNQIGFGSSESGVTGTTTFTHTGGLVTLGNTSSEGNYLRVLGNSAASSTTYDGLKVERYYPRITLTDTGAGGSSFQIWNLASQLRVGTAAGSSATAAMILLSGSSGNSMFLGNMVVGGGSATWETDTKLHVKGHAKVTQNFSATTYYSGSTLLGTVISNVVAAALAAGGAGTTVSGGTNISVTTVGSTATVNGTQVITRGVGAYSMGYGFTDFMYDGATPSTWDLPILKAHVKFNIVNYGMAPLTVDTPTASPDIYELNGAGATTSININQNEVWSFTCNGTYWVAYKLTM